MSTLMLRLQEAHMDRPVQCSRHLSEDSSASKFDAVNEAKRCRLNGTRRTVYGVGVFSIDVDDGITTVVIRTARANASPVTSSRDRHCTAVRNATRAATGIAKIRLAKAIHIPRRRSTYVRTVRTSVVKATGSTAGTQARASLQARCTMSRSRTYPARRAATTVTAASPASALTLPDLPQSTKRRPRYNPRRCGCWPASRFDAVDETY